eukprot:9256936-Pyramimonas_sp.AAC.1
MGGTHAGCAIETFRGAPYGATKRCTGCGRRMRAAPLGPRSAVLGVGGACGLRHWDFRWSFLWSHAAMHLVWVTHSGCATAT